MTDLTALIRDLVVANRILASEDVVDAYGHVSVRHPDKPDRFLIATSLAPEMVGEVAAARIDQLIAVDGFGEVGDRTDTQLHGQGLLQILPVLGKDRAVRNDLSRGGH